MTLTWYRHIQRNGGLNQILRRQTSYSSCIYNYLCNRCISPLALWVRIMLIERRTRYNITWCSLSMTCGRSVDFSGTLISSTNKTYRHDITEIFLWVQTPFMARCTRYHITWCSLSVTCGRSVVFSGTLISLPITLTVTI